MWCLLLLFCLHPREKHFLWPDVSLARWVGSRQRFTMKPPCFRNSSSLDIAPSQPRGRNPPCGASLLLLSRLSVELEIDSFRGTSAASWLSALRQQLIEAVVVEPWQLRPSFNLVLPDTRTHAGIQMRKHAHFNPPSKASSTHGPDSLQSVVRTK